MRLPAVGIQMLAAGSATLVMAEAANLTPWPNFPLERHLCRKLTVDLHAAADSPDLQGQLFRRLAASPPLTVSRQPLAAGATTVGTGSHPLLLHLEVG